MDTLATVDVVLVWVGLALSVWLSCLKVRELREGRRKKKIEAPAPSVAADAP